MILCEKLPMPSAEGERRCGRLKRRFWLMIGWPSRDRRGQQSFYEEACLNFDWS